jgi:hypothetical protein
VKDATTPIDRPSSTCASHTREGATVSKIYRLSWEMVKQGSLHKYCDANPVFYKNTTQLVPNAEIPDDEWELIVKAPETEPFGQFNNLCASENSGFGFIRNVKLETGSIAEFVATGEIPHR